MEELDNTMQMDNEEVAIDVADEAEKYLTFFIDSQLYTIPSSQVIEIISMQLVTYMPSVPDFVKGVINIRGKVIPVIELQMRLKKTCAVYDEHTCIVVVEIGDNNVGFIVDQVQDVTDISKQQIAPPPKVSKAGLVDQGYLCGIAKLSDGIAMVLDSVKIMQDKEKKNKDKADVDTAVAQAENN